MASQHPIRWRRWTTRAAFAVAALSVSATFEIHLASASDVPQPAVSEEDAIFFERSVRPLLAAKCWECHAGESPEAGLRLDAWDTMVAGGDSGPAVVPGKPADSLLITAIHYEDGPQMPPDGKLRDQDIEILIEWINRGAPWPKSSITPRTRSGSRFEITDDDRAFWSFQPIADPPVPGTNDAAWPRTTIDHFILARLEDAGLAPSRSADKRTLIRRATFDLTGLPPTPDEIEAFL